MSSKSKPSSFFVTPISTASRARTAAERRFFSGKVRYHEGSTTVMTDAPYIMA